MPVSVKYCRIISKTGTAFTGIFNMLLFLILLVPSSVHAQQLNYDEVSITLNVPRVGSTEISALINDDDLFLSVKEVFDFLKIKNSVTLNSDSLFGFIVNPKDVFLIDKVTGKITYGNTQSVLKQDELIGIETGIFLKVFYFGKIFGLDCDFNFRNLSLTLSVKTDLPLLREMQQELIRENLKRLKAEKKPDTTISRKFSFFQLGTADWMVTATQEKRSGNYTRASVSLGGILAGGEADVYTNYTSNYGFEARQQYFKWRYVNNEHSALRQVTVGRINVPVISTLQGPLTGIQLSNTPTTYRHSFGTYTISNTTKPGWTVELYVDNVLVNYTKADASGFFTFDVPMMYGNTVVKLRYYGPMGEEISHEQMISVPFNFLPNGKFEYNISAGNILDEQKSRFSRGNFNYGFSNSITVGTGMEYISSRSFRKSFPFVNASIRLGNNTIVSAERAQGVRTKGTLNYRTARNLQLQLNYVKYQKRQNAVLAPYVEERSVVVSFPYKGKRFNSFTRLTYQRFFLPEAKSTNAEFLISASAYKINSNFTTKAVSYPNSLDIYSELSVTGRLPLNIRFTPLLQYEYTGKKVSKIKMELEKTVFNNGAMNLSYEKNTITRSHIFSLGIRLSFSMATGSFSAIRNGNISSFVQTAGGSLIYDGKTSYKSFSKNYSVGKGALSVVAFLDLNNNGVRDSKEPAVPGLKFNINGGKLVQDEVNMISRVLDLEAYRTYFLEVDPRSFDNIFWWVKNKTIAIETDPNYVKLIEVPVSVVSEASGYVYMKTPKGLKGLGRMIVNFYGADSVFIGRTLTEQDGFFSYMGLTPGTYVAALDTGQVRLLNFESSPGLLSFTIANTEEGVIADGFQFTLTSHKDEGDDAKQVNNSQGHQSPLIDSVNAAKHPENRISKKPMKEPTGNVQNKKTLNPPFRQKPGTEKQLKKAIVKRDTSFLRKDSIEQKHDADTTSKSYLNFKPDTNTLVVKQQPAIKSNQETRKNSERLSNKKGDSSTYLQKKTGPIQKKSPNKSSQSKTPKIDGNNKNNAKTNKPKHVGVDQAVSSQSKKIVPKAKPKTNYQKTKTGPSAEEQQKLLDQLQRLLKKAKPQKPELAFVLFYVSEV